MSYRTNFTGDIFLILKAIVLYGKSCHFTLQKHSFYNVK